MPKRELSVQPGQELDGQLKQLLDRFFQAEVVGKLEREGGCVRLKVITSGPDLKRVPVSKGLIAELRGMAHTQAAVKARLDAFSVDSLKDVARALDMSGYSKQSKEDLISRIAGFLASPSQAAFDFGPANRLKTLAGDEKAIREQVADCTKDQLKQICDGLGLMVAGRAPKEHMVAAILKALGCDPSEAAGRLVARLREVKGDEKALRSRLSGQSKTTLCEICIELGLPTDPRASKDATIVDIVRLLRSSHQWRAMVESRA